MNTIEQRINKWFESFKDGSYWKSENIDKHRRGISDMEWAGKQPSGPPKYKVGDVVEFMVGGFGKIDKVSQPHNGWPSSYSTEEVKDMEPHPKRICAWHYEGDIKKLVARSYARKVRTK